MTEKHLRGPLTRRGFLAGAAGLTGATIVGARLAGSVPVRAATDLRAAAAGTHPQKNVHLVGTDGWVSMPQGAPADPPFFPDSLAPDPFNTYVFGFRNVTGLSPTEIAAQRGKAQISAPMLDFDEEDDITIALTNLGLQLRPDLVDGHTLHWHGFRNAIPFYDGVPESSIAVPSITTSPTSTVRRTPARTCTTATSRTSSTSDGHARHRVRPPGAEQRAGRNKLADGVADGDVVGETGYDREFAIMLSEIDARAHFGDAHIQAPTGPTSTPTSGR